MVFSMNLGKQLNKLDRLKKQRHDAKKMQEYYTRQKAAAKNVKAHKKAKDNEEFYLQRIATLDTEIRELETSITKTENELKEEAYRKDLTNFYNSMLEGFSSLKLGIKDTIAGKHSDLISSIDYVGLVYQEQAQQFKSEDLQMFRDYPILTLKGQIGRILEEEEAAFRITTTRGAPVAAQKRANIETWSRNLLGQIESVINAMKARMK
jgi:hypothetical protein